MIQYVFSVIEKKNQILVLPESSRAPLSTVLEVFVWDTKMKNNVILLNMMVESKLEHGGLKSLIKLFASSVRFITLTTCQGPEVL